MRKKPSQITFTFRDFVDLEKQLREGPRSEEPILNSPNWRVLSASGKWRVEDFVHLWMYIHFARNSISLFTRFYREMPRQPIWVTIRRAIERGEIKCVVDRDKTKRLDRDSCMEFLMDNFPNARKDFPELAKIKPGKFEHIKNRNDVKLQLVFSDIVKKINEKNQLYRKRKEPPLRKSSYLRIANQLNPAIANITVNAKKGWLNSIPKLKFDTRPGFPTEKERKRESQIIASLSR